jgi:hypothetical protein
MDAVGSPSTAHLLCAVEQQRVRWLSVSPVNKPREYNGVILLSGFHNVGYITSFAGGSNVTDWDPACGTNAYFGRPNGIAADSSGNLFVTETSDHFVRRINGTGCVEALAGTHLQSGSVDGHGTSALFGNPGGVAVDSNRNVFVADNLYGAIRKVSSTGNVSTVHTDSSRLFKGIAVSTDGNLFVSDGALSQILTIPSTGGTSTVYAGTGISAFVNGPRLTAAFQSPVGLVFSSTKGLFVADMLSNAIRVISTSGKLILVHDCVFSFA